TCYFLELTNRKLNSFDFEYSKLVEYVSGNICRCTGHISIKRSLHNMLRKFYDKYKSEKITIDTLVKEEIIPCYFSDIKSRLKALQQTNLIMSGGTDLYVQNMHHTGGIELKSYKRTDTSLIYDSGGEIVISAFATVTDLCNSNLILKYFPEIPTYRELFGSVQIRNKATAGGNIINASPIGDTVNILMALDAALVLTSEHGERILPLRKFYTGYKTNVSQKDETLTEIRIKIPKGRYIFSYEKVSKRMHLDIASVNSTMYMEYEGNRIIKASISAGGVAPCPVYLENTSEYLKGKEISQDTFSEIENIIQSEISPINDVRGSATYKRLLLGRLVKMHFIKYFPELAEVII
ncbi:MAG TPA: FAD binding domain-containing protein, partial [Ignavibacteria bacterium]|nr:FAD binding domain-containing protein [Ignavibacteria bacterium]